MAETVVNFVLGKLADAAIKEVLFLWVVREKVEKVQEELVRIQAFLKDADSCPVKDERQRNWVKEVRDVAYSIEDVINTAVMLKEDTPPENLPKKMEISQSSCFPCKTSAVKKLFRKSKNIPVLHELGNEIDSILAKMKEIEESRARYGINNIGEGSGGTGSRLPMWTKPIVVPGIDDPNVIGFEEDLVNILKLLRDANTTRRSVVSIVGTGGLGKTTLALKAYNRIVTEDAGIKAWVTVSKEFKLIDLLKKIVTKFGSEDTSNRDEEYFLTKLHECCMGKKYLIVLDDVWTTDLWTQLEKVLPDENNGSRVLITTRSLDVAEKADPLSKPYKLNFLSPKLSLDLLLKKAIPSHDPIKDYPRDLVDLAEQFIKKCGGLPLALMVLGGLLSTKTGYNAWTTVMRTMNWEIQGKECIGILASSFEDLPLSHKYCFMYFAMFPEDFEIGAKALVRMWVAEGLIPQLQNGTLEEIGEGFLNDLVQRCMIQVSSRSYDGSIEKCRIHDLLRDLAMEKAKEDNFLMVSSTDDDMTSCCSARRLAAHHSNCGELTKYTSKNLRSLVCLGPPPDCSKQRLLKVLRTKLPDQINLKCLEGLTQLRYLEVVFRKKKLEEDEYFERLLCSMKFLQTLDLRESKVEDIPDCIWHIKTLRHVMFNDYVDGPPPSIYHRNLQTLSFVKSRTSWSTEGTPNLPNLRILDMDIVEGLSWEMLAGLLATIKYLKELRLWNYNDSFKVPDMSAFLFYPFRTLIIAFVLMKVSIYI